MEKLSLFYNIIMEVNFKSIFEFVIYNKEIRSILFFLIVFILIGIIYLVIKKYIIFLLNNKLSPRFKNRVWYKSLSKNNIVKKALSLGFFLIVSLAAYKIIILAFIYKFFFIILIIKFLISLNYFLLFINEVYQTLEYSKKNPIKGYLQLLKIFIYFFAFIIVISVVLGKSPVIFLGSLSALTAVLLLVFRDTILSLVASIQIFSNKLISTGDWLEVPLFKADGEVVDVNLHQVIIKNWDKSQTVIPIHKLMESSFKNWRNMLKEGRRIKFSIWIDQKSIKFCDKKLFDNLKKKKELEEIFSTNAFDKTTTRITNLFLFRQYILQYFKNHRNIKIENATLMVRNLEPTPNGLPVQIYIFCNVTEWVEYESIKSTILEHLISTAQIFELNIFQLEINKNAYI